MMKDKAIQMSNPNFLNSNRNYRGGIAAARRQALKDISHHQHETAPQLPWLGPRSCEVGYYCWTAHQLSKDRMITYLNKELGL